jgi:hypothetical protein
LLSGSGFALLRGLQTCNRKPTYAAPGESAKTLATVRPVYGPDYYAAFIIYPDGYRIEAYYGPPET